MTRHSLLFVVLVGCTPAVWPPRATLPPKSIPLTRIAFGSCAKELPISATLEEEEEHQAIWDALLAAAPELFLWTGDAVYVDEVPSSLDSVERRLECQRMLLQRRLKLGNYQRFIAQVPVNGVWDDHDYGRNNAGASLQGKERSQENYLNFLAEPETSPRRRQAGIYQAFTHGPPDKRIKIYLLDTRYHMQRKGKKADLLGTEQWAWLEREISESDAQLNVFVSSIQILVRQDLRGQQWFGWPAARRRALKLLNDTPLSGVLFVTGDKHFGTIESSQDDRLPHKALDTMSSSQDRQVPHEIFEVMSSGLTTGSIVSGNDLALVRLWYGPANVVTEPNFGMIVVDWDAHPVQVTLQIRDGQNRVRLERRLILRGRELELSGQPSQSVSPGGGPDGTW